ncbi:adenosylcobinamide-GDP ribazoletransferase [Sedimentibacter acidaminivorans]|uniref:Adenosylcobinamide-GDP ribazoletransferase n=1 Tax=Sedimentibacter acidaminivorans TaxID=913099 RepID=A0ABS4GCR4_9FIRM|nr:adenosylcobinamide-GDP ribazoletransferase [Sedimentibacter acidaminivorans]MBP1925483.1 adenosylcobinamide-GDP ribazoletransferase [Sedimentibacter acidaminivorans]
MASGFLVLISFFTRIPIGNKIEYNEESFKKALSLYSLMGVIIGIILFIVAIIGSLFRFDYVMGLLLTMCYTIVTGGLHFDGAADTCDGLFSGRTGDRIFEIMSDSHVGAFGVLCLIFVVLSQFVLFSNIGIFACFIMPIVGRTSVIVSSWNKKYAKKSKGMGTVFIESINTEVLIINILILTICCIIIPNKILMIIASVVTLISAYLISNWIEKKIGGMTGDTCGFITEICQIIFMFSVILLQELI